MKKPLKNFIRNQRHRGFSLIVTVSMMVLLALLAVGLLSLSTLSLRASNQQQALREARGNARMAAIMAIGQLQSLTGLDTRITASAKLVDQGNVEVAGAWRSWEGTNHDDSGRPIPPDYGSKNDAGDPTEPIDTSGSGRFLGFLTSTSVGQSIGSNEVPGSSTTQSGDQIKMVSTGTLDTADQVFLEPTIINSDDGTETGAFSWWTSGDNTKALVNVGSDETPDSAADWQKRLRGNRLPDPDVFGLSELDKLSTDDAYVASRRSLELVPSATLSGDEFYDLTAYNRGLMTNVATGGWRKDLSLFSETYSRLSSRDRLPLFAHTPGESLNFNKATQSARPANSLLYHWADYKGNSGGSPWTQTPPICAWEALVNYMKKYEELTSRSAASLSMVPTAGSVGGSGPGARYNFQEEIRVFPVVARIKWILSLGSIRTGRQYNPGIVLTPIVTLWNPYNVSLRIQNYSMNFRRVFPLRLSYRVDSQQFTNVDLNSIINDNIAGNFGTIALGPGENKVFGVNNPIPVKNSGNQALQFTEGYTPNGGVIFTGIGTNNNEIAVSDGQFTITNVEFTAARTGIDGSNLGEAIAMRFHATSGDQRVQNTPNIITMTYIKDQIGGDSIINQLYPPLRTRITTSISQASGTNNVPFTSATLGLRMIAPPPIGDDRFDNIRTKGILHSNPLQQYAEVGVANDNSAVTNLAGSGANHPINAPYDFMFEPAGSWNDSSVTVDFDQANRGYLVSGNTVGTGVQRCVVAELPTAPLQSLADLQHFDVRNNNQMPPFQFNLIGNASAHPIFAPDQVSIDTSGNFGDLTNDDSYLLNHLLFDDWFMSSIAPDLRDFTNRSLRSVTEVMTDFLEDEEPLPNWFYQPSSYANSKDSGELSSTFAAGRQDRDTGLYPFQSAASLLEVDGMFNINSVSVDAWRAILRRNRDLEVPHFSGNGSVVTEGSESPAFPRSTVAGDVVTTGSTAVDNGAPLSATVSGYTALSEGHIDALAEEIVEQVRQRGPFLSLGEFVNRQLNPSETDLSLAGTIQRALDELADSADSSRNPFLDLINAGEMIDSTPPGQTDFKFPEAALGSSNFGVPGWIRQADILRPLAPIMSARDDTFTIRAYGDSRDPAGRILARAWAEVVVQRTAEFVDSVDDAVLNPHSSEIESEINRRFGRRYKLVSFRWLNDSEV